MGNETSLIVLINPKQQIGVGESLSGDKAFYINVTKQEDWPQVEANSAFKELTKEEQLIVRKKFPIVLERFQIISASHFT
jgi:hypothetical protein